MLATVGIWAALITLAYPPAELITLGTYYAVSVVMIEVDLGLALAQLLKYWYSGTRPGTAAESVTQYARMYSATGIGGIVTAVLVILGMAAARFANRLKALLPKRSVEPVERPVVPPEEKASVPPEKKPTGPDERGPADETVSQAAWRGKLQLLQGRIAALRRRFTGSGSTDQAMNAEITRLETAAQDMATRPASAASCAPSKARSATRSAGWTGWTCGRRPRCSRTWRSASGWTPGPSPAIWTTPSASAS